MANKLAKESSPYLQQHAHNPVDWYPWGEEAFEKAASEHKPVLVSIGYATCHWCHVMEKESFENEEVAAFMNDHFVCIKVDREEHPDVDHFYMDALLAMQQSGGWPLNMFVTPDKLPFYGGTYFPPQKIYHRPSWMEVLEAMRLTWHQRREEAERQAVQLKRFLEQSYLYETESAPVTIDTDVLIQTLARQYDAVNGGFGMAPKFPGFNVTRMLLQVARSTAHTEAPEMALFTLRKILAGGIYDVVGGGLCRYATDSEWKVPHFEKMLYDNALLLTVLSQAYTFQQDRLFKHRIEQVIRFCSDTLGKDGLFMSALDADSEGEEGKYYVWTYDELEATDGFCEAIEAFWGLRREGNWEEGKNILHQERSDEDIIRTFELMPREWELMKQQFLMALWHKRQLRVPPVTDTKIMLDQNALMATALLQAYKALGNENYRELGLNVTAGLIQRFVDVEQQAVWHISDADTGKKIPANLDDIAYLLQALLHAYSVTSDAAYMSLVGFLTEYATAYFSDEQSILFRFSDSRRQDVAVRKIAVHDGAVLSSNAIMCENLWWAGQIQADLEMTARARRMLESQRGAAQRYPVAYASWIVNAVRMQQGWSIVKKNTPVTSFEQHIFYNRFLEQKLLYHMSPGEAGAAGDGNFNTGNGVIEFQECNEGYCKMPVNTVFELNL